MRTDRLELAVWREVCALLAHPERLAQEFTRRLHADGQGQRQERTALEHQVGKLRQGLARLIDSYAEGLIEKQEFEPRVLRLRQRITHVEAQCQQLTEAETLQHELQLIIGRVEEFAAQVHQNLDGLEWPRKREILRALVRRVEIGLDQVQVVFRVDALSGEVDPEKKSLQLCKRSPDRALRQTGLRPCQESVVHNARFQKLPDEVKDVLIGHTTLEDAQEFSMMDRIEVTFEIALNHIVVLDVRKNECSPQQAAGYQNTETLKTAPSGHLDDESSYMSVRRLAS